MARLPLVVLGDDQPILTSLLQELAEDAGYDGLDIIAGHRSPDEDEVREMLTRAWARSIPVFALAHDCRAEHADDIATWTVEFGKLTRVAHEKVGVPVHVLQVSDGLDGALQPIHDLLFRRPHLHLASCLNLPQLRAQFLKRVPRRDARTLSEVVPARSRLFKFDTMTTDEHLLTWRITSAIAKRGMNIVRARIFAWDTDAYVMVECEATRPTGAREYQELERLLHTLAPRREDPITPFDHDGAPLDKDTPDISKYMRMKHSSFHSQPGVLKAMARVVGEHRALLREVVIETPSWDPARNSLVATLDIRRLSADEVRALRAALDAIPALKDNPLRYDYFDAA